MKKKNGFTLIELIAVLVILAILALIVTPLVMSIIKKARISADKRSIHAYGRSVEIAIANYLLDNGSFPTDISQLSIEYSGDRVECSTIQLNSDSTVYLAGCTVAGRNVDYSYGTEEIITYDEYSIGDEVTYNGVEYYTIENSGSNDPNVILLKKTPLSQEEVNTYGAGHVNMYATNDPARDWYQQANADGSILYYSSPDCTEYSRIDTGCINDYESSEIKYVVDGWAKAKVASGLKVARLIKLEDLENLGYDWVNISTSGGIFLEFQKTENTPSWVYSVQSWWTMSECEDSSTEVWYINSDGSLTKHGVNRIYGVGSSYGTVRPVIEISKSVLSN